MALVSKLETRSNKSRAAPPMSEFLSQTGAGLYAVKAEDCAEFGATMEKGLRKRQKKRTAMWLTTRVWPEHWAEAAALSGDAPFRIWLTADIYVVLKRMEGGEAIFGEAVMYGALITIRTLQIDTFTRPADTIDAIAADVAEYCRSVEQRCRTSSAFNVSCK